MFKRFLPFIIAGILAILLSFCGTTQAFIGGMGLVLGFLLSIFINEDDESAIERQLRSFREDLNSVSSQQNKMMLDDKDFERQKDIRELDRRLRVLERNLTGNDPFGG